MLVFYHYLVNRMSNKMILYFELRHLLTTNIALAHEIRI